ncbi:MAG: AI-2E family transporter [Candidatus Nanohalobium sp.]
MDLQKGFLISVILVLLFVTGKMLQPFLGYLLGTLMVAFVLYPVHQKLSPKIGERASAFLLIILTLVVAIIPFALAVNAVIDDARDLTGNLNQSELVIDTGIIEDKIKELTGRSIDIEAQLESALNTFISTTIGNVSTVLDIVTNLAIGLSLSFFILYYLLKDGKALKDWVMDTTPMPMEIQKKLYKKTNKTTWAVVKGHVAVAIIQGSVAGLGLYATGIGNSAFWTFVMILLAFIPIVGAFLVWGPAGAYLFLTGKPAAGTFLLIWGTVVVGLTDNFLRPLLVDRSSELHPGIILIGVIGGVYVFGAAGIFMGPIAFGVLKSVLEVFKNNYDEL